MVTDPYLDIFSQVTKNHLGNYIGAFAIIKALLLSFYFSIGGLFWFLFSCRLPLQLSQSMQHTIYLPWLFGLVSVISEMFDFSPEFFHEAKCNFWLLGF